MAVSRSSEAANLVPIMASKDGRQFKVLTPVINIPAGLSFDLTYNVKVGGRFYIESAALTYDRKLLISMYESCDVADGTVLPVINVNRFFPNPIPGNIRYGATINDVGTDILGQPIVVYPAGGPGAQTDPLRQTIQFNMVPKEGFGLFRFTNASADACEFQALFIFQDLGRFTTDNVAVATQLPA